MKTIKIKVAISNDDFIGLVCKNDKMSITFPIGYNIEECSINTDDEDALKKYQQDIKCLLKILETKNDDVKINSGIYPFSFSTAMHLIEDYFNNGLITFLTWKNNQLDIGHIDWQKTLIKSTPIYSADNLIYLNSFYKNKELEGNDITLIQLKCLHISFLVLGMFYNNYQVPDTINMSKEKMLNKLRNELLKTNVDKNRRLITMMINFLEGTDISNIGEDEIKIGQTGFNVIWERLIRKKVLKLHQPFNAKPHAYYRINEDKISASSLIPDIISENDNKVYIIDAKYYRIGYLPETSDIAKQLVYARYISKKTKKKITNIFLLPNNVEDGIKYYGEAFMDGFNKEESIKVYHVDTKSIINT